MRKNIISFSIVIFMSMIMINSASALNVSGLEHLPDVPNNSNKFYIIKVDNPEQTSYPEQQYLLGIAVGSNRFYIYKNDLYIWEKNELGIVSVYSNYDGNFTTHKMYYTNDNLSEWILISSSAYGGGILNTQGYGGYHLYYSSLDIYLRNNTTKVLDAGYLNPYYKNKINIDIQYLCDHDNKDVNYVDIDFSNFVDESYSYQISTNNYDWIDLGHDILNYRNNYYTNTKIYARILDENNNIVTSAEDIMQNPALKNSYYIRIHTNIPNYDDFGFFMQEFQFISEDYINFDTLFNPYKEEIEQLGYSIGGYYLNHELTEEFSPKIATKDTDIYLKILPAKPKISATLAMGGYTCESNNCSNEKNDNLYLIINIIEWKQESNNYILKFSTERQGFLKNYSYDNYMNNYSTKFLMTNINSYFYDDVFLAEYYYNDDLIDFEYYHLSELIENNEEIKDIFNFTNENFEDNPNTNNIDNFLKTIKKPIEAISQLIQYFYNSLNIYLKGFIITIFSTLLIAAFIKFMR